MGFEFAAITVGARELRNVGRRLLLRRFWLGLSQEELAQKATVTRNMVSALERGVRGLDAWVLARLADALGVTLDWLLNGPDDEVGVPGTSHRRTP